MIFYTECHYSKNVMETLAKWETIVTICTGLLALISIIPVMVLLYVHLELIFENLTTNEDVRSTKFFKSFYFNLLFFSSKELTEVITLMTVKVVGRIAKTFCVAQGFQV
jgi:hypothetical protein